MEGSPNAGTPPTNALCYVRLHIHLDGVTHESVDCVALFQFYFAVIQSIQRMYSITAFHHHRIDSSVLAS